MLLCITFYTYSENNTKPIYKEKYIFHNSGSAMWFCAWNIHQKQNVTTLNVNNLRESFPYFRFQKYFTVLNDRSASLLQLLPKFLINLFSTVYISFFEEWCQVCFRLFFKIELWRPIIRLCSLSIYCIKFSWDFMGKNVYLYHI